ncbi:heparan-alpha-glucosaminide N-acetyltransferase isoform X1 [Magallana gigas]|uniref:heparan-alpha-glucosaminide N-acetyltransferase isoform X1 n=1 Tax=Magallana gigas TaxID=29159 RepID=UPI0005C3537E|eukprot:XP_011447071.1 PREDICTED: heparan-alpha-glucosaminide N-acetyltransferase-like isoform X1 [Crassostrea gigas]
MAGRGRMKLCILQVLYILTLWHSSQAQGHVPGHGLVKEEIPIQCPNVDDKMNNARISILYTSGVLNQNPDYSVALLYQTEECYKCPLVERLVILNNSTSCNILIDSRWNSRLEIRPLHEETVKQDPSCKEDNLSEKLHENGTYDLYVTFTPNDTGDKTVPGTVKCRHLILENMPADSYIPIYVAIGCIAGVSILITLGKLLYKKRWYCLNRLFMTTGNESLINPKKSDSIDDRPSAPLKPTPRATLRQRKPPKKQKQSVSNSGGDLGAYTSEDLGVMQTTINPADEQDSRPKKERLKSLDTFRGISIIVMIFVNYGGGGYWFFRHSRWNGLTFADLVFPWFIWIMGTAMAYSFTGMLRRVTPKHKIFWKIFKRSCILFVLGLLVNTGGCDPTRLTHLRIPGVLQRFAGTYLVVASIHMFFAKTVDVSMYTYWGFIRDIVDFWLEWILHIVFVTVHIIITFTLDVPGCGKGYIGPGGLHEAVNSTEASVYQNCTGGAAGYIDRQVFGDDHIYQSPTCKPIYKTTVPYDPEGLLGTLNSVFMCYLGLQAGKILMTFKEPSARVKRFLIWGLFLCLIAGALCGFKKDGGTIPLNKNLWSLSFVLCMAGFAFVLLAFCYVTIDVYKVWSGAPFYFPGMNPIVLYMGHEVLHRHFPISWEVSQYHYSLLSMDLWGTVFWVLVGLVLYKKRIFITV